MTRGSRGTVAIIGGNDRSLWANRGDLIGDLLARGWKVHAVLPNEQGAAPPPSLDIPIHRIPLARAGLNPVADFRAIRYLRALIDRLEPDVVLAYNPKPVAFGGLALRSKPNIRYVALVTGRGPLSRRPGLAGRVAFTALGALYGRALERADVVLFQNEDDRSYFTERWRLDHATVDTVAGSGVNLDRFPSSDPPDGPPRFLMISKLLIDKGVREFVQAAQIVAQISPGVRFRVVGGHEPHLPHALPLREVDSWTRGGLVDFTGHVSDVRPHLAWSSVLCHPSYAEGTPRAVLEAMSSGRAIITTDAPGCRQTIEEGRSGFLVPVADPASLAEKMAQFVHQPELARVMGQEARARAERVFDVRKVNDHMLHHLEGRDAAA